MFTGSILSISCTSQFLSFAARRESHQLQTRYIFLANVEHQIIVHLNMRIISVRIPTRSRPRPKLTPSQSALWSDLVEHRSEVDGLRAVAVLPILLFHAGFSLFKGGYIGVDVFFVISGYLISSILLTELGENRFSFSRFYERRARRILPALLIVLGACLLASWYLLPPEELVTFSKSLVSVLLLNSNNHFASLKGYFNLATWRDPLLHTWSLAVEEQYYLIFPLFLTVGWRLRRNTLKNIILALCVLSLLLADITVHSNPIGAFYRLPTRMWELLIGTLLR